MNYPKHQKVYPHWQLIAATICLILALLILSVWCADAAAVPAPTTTPPPVQHWELLQDDSQAYLLTQPGCVLGIQELGEDSWRFVLECDPVGKGE